MIKQIFLLCLWCLMFPLLVHASPSETAEYRDSVSSRKPYKQTVYWKRHRVEKTCGIVAVSLGSTVFLGGGFCYVLSGMAYDDRSMKAFKWITIGGAVCAVASIPLFVLAHKDAKRAKAVVRVNPSIVTCRPVSGYMDHNLALRLSVSF